MPPSFRQLSEDLDQVMERLEPHWKSLNGQRIFMTGGTGFIGTWLLESLLWACHRLALRTEVHLLTRNPEGFRLRAPHLVEHPSVFLVPGDLTKASLPVGSFQGLVHAAVENEAPLAHYRHALDGTFRLLDFAERAGVERILFTSSGAVYGRQPLSLDRTPEDYPGAPPTEDPRTAYGQAKRASEFLFSAFARTSRTEVAIARCFAFVGPRLPLDANYAVGNFIRDALQGGPIRIQGDGTPLRSYLYAADLAAWLWTLFFRGPSAQPVNVGSDEAISILELARSVVRVLAPEARIEVARTPEPGQPPERYVPCIARAKGLGLAPWTSLEDGIARTARWQSSLGGPAS